MSELPFEEIKQYLSEYLLRTELLRALKENITSRELEMTDCYILFYSDFGLGDVVEKFHGLKHVEELNQEYRLDILNAFEECAHNRINGFSKIAKNVKERA